jgi:ribosomal protein S18 acetylase RimI-like enzyme
MTAPAFEMATLDTGLRPRRVGGQDLPMLVETLVAAFVDDPVMRWGIPDAHRRPEILRAFFEITVDVYQPYGELYITDPTPAAGAVWIPPGCQPTGEQAEQLVAWYVEATEENSERFLAAIELLDECHPQEPHHYLFFLGTRPEWQSRGLGSALLREVLERCDREGRPAYLEASSEGNQRLYRRHGFEVTGEIRLPDGPSMWPMWREPAGQRERK